MRKTALQRSAGALAVFAGLAVFGATANAAITVRTVTPAAGVNSTAVVAITDTVARNVISYDLYIYFKSDQAEFISADKPQLQPGDITASNVETIVAPTDGFDRRVRILLDQDEHWTAATDLALVNFNYLGGSAIETRLEFHPDEFYMVADSNDDPVQVSPPGIVAGSVASYGSPVITDYTPQGAAIEETGTVTITLTGTNFYPSDGVGGAPDTTVEFNGATYTPDSISNTEIQFSVTPSALQANNSNGIHLSNANDSVVYEDAIVNFYSVNRDIAFVDDDFTEDAGDFIPASAPYKVKGANAFATIQGGVTAVNSAKMVIVAEGTYAENITVPTSKNGVSVLGGANDTTKIVAAGTGYHQILMSVPATGVKVSGLSFDVSEYVGAALLSKSTGSIEVADCDFYLSGLAALGTNRGLSATDKAGLGSNWGPRGVIKSGGTLTYNENTVSSFSQDPNIHYLNAVQAFNAVANITDNNIAGAYRDVYLYESQESELTGNKFARNVNIQNPNKPVNLYDNTFNNVRGTQIDPVVFPLHNEAALTIQHSTTQDVNIYDNDFLNTGRAIWIGASKHVTVDNNTFTPADSVDIVLGDLGPIDKPLLNLASDKYSHILIDSDSVASNGPEDSQVIVTNNTFNDSAADGSAVQLKNTVGKAFDLTFTGNTFNALNGIDDRYVTLDNGFTQTVDLTANNIGTVAASALSLPQAFDVEDHTFHSLDANGTGLARWVAQKIYVTDLSDKIQRGVNAATAGDTIHVQAATYDEYYFSANEPYGLMVEKQVTLLGPNAGIAGAGPRNPEAVIRPDAYLNAAATLDSGYSRLSDWHPVVYLAAPGVVFDGFKVTGSNNDLTEGEGPAQIAGTNLAAATGIYCDSDNLTVQNNIAEDFSYIGIWGAGYWTSSSGDYENILVQANLVHNVQSEAGYGYGYYIGGTSGSILNNYAVNVRAGMNIQPYDNKGTTAICSGNHLNAWKTGLWYNYTENNTTQWSLTGNQVTAAPVPASLSPSPTSDGTVWGGIVTQTMYASGSGGLLSLNTVDGTGATLADTHGIRVLSSIPSPTDNLVFETNKIEDVDVGIYVGIQGAGTYAGKVTLQNANEIFNTETAILIDAPNNTVHSIVGNNIHDNTVGIQIANGGKADVTGNSLTDNAKQFAFSTDSTVNTFASSDLLASNLETVINANTLVGKTYISAGMADTQGLVVPEGSFVNVRNTIQSSITPTEALTNTVKVMAGNYVERVALNKQLRLQGASNLAAVVQPSPTIDTGLNGVGVQITANGSICDGLAVTREAVNAQNWGDGAAWGSGKALFSGIQVFNGVTGCIVSHNSVTNFFNGIYANDCPANTYVGNLVEGNRFGIQVANNISNSEFTNNTIRNNAMTGIGFNEPGSTVNKTTALIIRNNSISGNGAYQVTCDWVAAKTDVLDLSGNWFGILEPTVNEGAVDHAGLTSTLPANIANVATIGGVGAKRLIDYNSWLAVGTEKPSASTTDLAFEGDFSTLYIASASPLAGTEDSHISDAVKLLADGALTGNARRILAMNGDYVDGVALVDKSVTVSSVSGERTGVTFLPKTAAQTGIQIAESDVTISNITIGRFNTTVYATAIMRPETGLWNSTKLENIAVTNAGGAGTYAVDLRQPLAGMSIGNLVTNSSFDNCGYAGLALFGGTTEVSGSCSFTNNSYQGLYAAPAGAYPGGPQGGTYPVVNVQNNTFSNNAVAVRLNTVDPSSNVQSNTMSVGFTANAPAMGISMEYTAATVSGNEITLGNANISGAGSIGIWVWGTAATLTNNTITGSGKASSPATGIQAVGLRVFPLAGTSGNESNQTHVTVGDDNDISKLKVGIALTNADTLAQAAKLTVSTTASAPNIKDNATAVLIDGAYATANIGASYMNGSDIGVDIKAASADSTFNSITFVRPDNNAKYIVNTSSNDYDVKNNSFDAAQGPVHTDTEIWDVQEYLVDALDETGYGHLSLKDDYVYVPASKIHLDSADNGVITRGVLAAKSGDTVAVQAGSYDDAAAIIDNKVVNLISASAPLAAHLPHPLTADMPAGSGKLTIDGFDFISNGSVVIGDATNDQSGTAFDLRNCEFTNLNAPTAITVDSINKTGASSNRSSITTCNVTGSQAGILISNSKSVDVVVCNLIDNLGTGIELKAGSATVANVNISGCIISGSGLVATDPVTEVDAQNYNAYGIFAGGTVKPASQYINITGNTITDNAATGIAMWYANSEGTGTTLVDLNTIENNGIFRKDDPSSFGQNTDGLKLKHSQNVTVTTNKIRNNVRANVTVEGNYANTGMGVEIHRNHLDGNVPQNLTSGATTVPFGGGLFLQIDSPQRNTTFVNANDNWWGHVYGPNYAGNTTGRGSKIVLNAGKVIATSWYGQRTASQQWYALNDQDGDGVVDAHEDLDLSGNITPARWGAESNRTVKDSDGDGYEDGAEARFGSDPTIAASTPLDIDANGTPDLNLDPMAEYADYTNNTKGNFDSDGDRFLDFYEVAMGTDPEDSNSKPTLGRVVTTVADIEVAQVTKLRRLLIGADSFLDTTMVGGEYVVNQDNGDVNRDAVVNNADLIFLRRFVALTTPSFPAVLPSIAP